MKVLETDLWCLLLPSEWQAEHDDGVVRILDRDGVGEIALATHCKRGGGISSDELLPMARAETPEIRDWQGCQLGKFVGLTGSFCEQDAYVREWYVCHGSTLLHVTYVCDEEDAGMDNAAVDEILGTLVAAAGGDPAD